MTENERTALRDAAQGAVLFHNGLWGAPMGFLWAGSDGSPAGRLPQWEEEALALLERRGLVAIRPGVGTRDVPVRATEAGERLLGEVRAAA
ncbi:hypothetical protein [Actinokineospora iranica]|uniref:Winged helix DNA-binding domain-containing protein n=1 Tax=Actinokineospora iranica TaxID=1271860 RepID=A0A1G6IQW0_9PSEU|nr:hypothetical protein [Actinokineospora iranica]SDC08864.1 hypothetical protein SAMN05216174_10163 [Actinokineospora iranica]